MEAKGKSLAELPPGWRREEFVRRKGLSAGKTEVYYIRDGILPLGWRREEYVWRKGLSARKTCVVYISPDGIKIRNKPQLARHLGDTYDLSTFDFRTGKINYTACRKRLRHESSLVLPIRQTASIFKQPVTVIRNHTDSQTKTDMNHGPQEPPKQLYWEKRLQGLRAYDISKEMIQPMDLPRNVQGVGPDLTTENVLQSISAALHLNTGPVTGQNFSRTSIQKNPGVNIEPAQPHMQHLMVSEDDIRRQEMKVREARRRLQDAICS